MALDSKWCSLDCFSSLLNHRHILHPIRTKDTNCSCRFIDCADTDVFLLLATARKRKREDALLGLGHGLWSSLDICWFWHRSPNLPCVISWSLDTSVSRMEKPRLDGSACCWTVLSRTWFSKYHEKEYAKPTKQLTVQQRLPADRYAPAEAER